ncbi:MAG TPA: CvpA family protein [bacterium]|nr:CvpA family protein [bacterium]HPR87099.1 CvpA family protein [bacterium]
MSPFDLIIIAALIWFVYQGAKTGMAKELIGLTGWLIAALVALKYGGWAGATAENLLPAIKVVPTKVSGFIIALLGTHLGFRAFGYMLKKMVGDKGQGMLDKFGGGLIGFVRGAFIISIIALAINSLDLGARLEEYQQRSSLFPHMSRFAQLVVDKVMPPARGAGDSSQGEASRQ